MPTRRASSGRGASRAFGGSYRTSLGTIRTVSSGGRLSVRGGGRGGSGSTGG